MNGWLLCIPLLSAAIGGGAVAIGGRKMFHMLSQRKFVDVVLEEFFAEADFISDLKKIVGGVDWEAEMAPFLDKKLENLVYVFKQQIPMAAMVLTPALTEKLNVLAKQEILKIAPDLKKLFLEKLSDRAVRNVIREKMLAADLEGIEKFLISLLKKWTLAASFGGFLVGILQLLLTLL